MEAAKYVSELVEKARVAQAVIENYTQEQVDALCKAMAKAIFDNAEPLARMAVDETGMGVYEDKVNTVSYTHLRAHETRASPA